MQTGNNEIGGDEMTFTVHTQQKPSDDDKYWKNYYCDESDEEND